MADSRRHQNLLQNSSNGSSNINMAASSSTTVSPSSSSHLGTLNQNENAVMIPLSAADLSILRANGIQFNTTTSLNNGGDVTGSDNLNLSFSGGNVILSSAVDGSSNSGLHGSAHSIIMDTGLADHHQRHIRQSQHQQNFQNISRPASRVIHSNEISSNGIIDTQSLGASSAGGNIISLGSNDGMLTTGVNSSASGLIQALGAAVSRAVASGSFPNLLSSPMNLPLSVNQGSIIGGNEIMALNGIPANIVSGTSGQLLVNQQHGRHQHHQPQQLVINQVSSLVDAGNIISSTPTVNIHHAAIGSSSGIGSRVGDGTVTASAAQGNSSGVMITLGPQQQQQQMWVQPDQSGFLPAAVSLAAQEALTLQAEQGSSSSQDRGASLQELQQASIDGGQYQDVRTQFAGVFHMQTQGSRPVSYQVAAHSTLEQASPTHDFQDIGDDSEATPSYSSIQQLSVDSQVAVNAAAHLIAGPSVDSSTIQQGYQLVYDAENRILTVQRVMSPSDCTVSQSTLSLEGSEAQANASLLSISSQPNHSYAMVHVSSVPPTFAAGSSSGGGAGEVSTSSMAAMLNAHGRVGGSELSSHTHVRTVSSSHGLVSVTKLEKVDLDGVAECDTTQEDLEFHQHRSPSYLDTSNNIDDEQSLDSTSLHSTIQGSGVATSGEVIMDSTLDSSDLTTLHPVTMATGELVNSQHSSVSIGKSVNLMARSDLESMPGPSGLQALRVNNADESVLIPSHSAVVANKFIRKSRRLQLVEQEPKASQRKRDYQTQHYNPDMLWCEDCMQAYDPSCPVHKLSSVQDKIVMSRAWASAPNQVQIFRIPETHLESGDSNVGVQAKRQIPKFTQFGPFVGELVDSMDSVNRRFFPLMLEYSNGSCKYFETEDENKCNWMMFVRPARTFAEQNMVAFQYKGDIYFSVTRLIECKQELKVWYAAHYAERLGSKPLKMTEEDLQALDEEDAKFGCFECSRKFRTSAALHQHLTTHDNEDMKDFDEAGGDDEDFNVNEDSGRKIDKQKGTYIRGKLTSGKRRNTNMDTGSYQWKKKSTSIYINKTLKKYKKRQQYSDKMSQNMRSMYRRQGKVSGGNEWMCTHCGLTFDNSSLLNLHTLTHAAEDLGMDEIKKLTEEQNGEMTQAGTSLPTEVNGDISAATLAAVMSLSSPMVACPKCNIVFNDQRSLMEHVTTHGQKLIKKEKPYGCSECSKSFTTEDKLIKHQMVHGDDADKPLECPVCYKRVMNNSAMACHMKTHSDRKYYDCPVCGEDFDVVANLREHSAKHMDEMGQFPCPNCSKTFYDFGILKKHMKTFHSDRVFDCPECNKPFPRVDKLRLHMLRHTSHKEFMCETCGKQFKRKDKFHEHKKRMHSKERIERQLAAKQKQNSLKKIGKFMPKVRPSEYHRFIYKCHSCLLGFKRRGMLVNHLAKRHPEIKPDQVPELNLPILKTQKDFYCQYCDKIYKSSSKRKAHIQKNHPGCQIPPSSWKKTIAPDGTRSSPSNTYSHTVSSITTMPHGCKFCHKQYASKAKLLQHQRKTHSELVEPVFERRRMKRCQQQQQQQQDFIHITVTDGSHGLAERYEAVPIAVVTQADTLPSADLLTQAMSELHSYASEFTISPRLGQAGAPTMVHIQSNGQVQPTTIDINQLNQALHSFTAQTGTVATVLTQPPQPASPTQSVTVVAPNGPQTINLGNAQFITRAWTGGFTPTFR